MRLAMRTSLVRLTVRMDYAPAPSYGYYDRWQRQHNTNNFSIDSQR